MRIQIKDIIWSSQQCWRADQATTIVPLARKGSPREIYSDSYKMVELNLEVDFLVPRPLAHLFLLNHTDM